MMRVNKSIIAIFCPYYSAANADAEAPKLNHTSGQSAPKRGSNREGKWSDKTWSRAKIIAGDDSADLAALEKSYLLSPFDHR